MTDAPITVDWRRRDYRLVSAITVFAVVVLALTCTAGVAAVPTDAQPESNASVAISYDGDAVVHQGEYVYVWRRKSLDVTVAVQGDGAATACLYRGPPDGERSLVECRVLDEQGDTTERTFESADYGVRGPSVYVFEVRVLDADNRTLTTATSRRLLRLTDWSALDDESLDDWAVRSGLVDRGGQGVDTTTPAPTTSTVTADNRSKRAQVAPNVSNSGNVDRQFAIPEFDTLPRTLTSGPVLFLGGGGLVALAALLFLQRRHGSGSTGADAQSLQAIADEGAHTDRETVVRLLQENDGRLNQSDIVAATDWSKAKVSRLLSRMADHDLIRKKQDGRQNIIVLRRED